MMYAFIAMSLSITSCSDDHDHGGRMSYCIFRRCVRLLKGELGEFCDEALKMLKLMDII